MKRAALALLVFPLCACATMGGMKDEPLERGSAASFSASLEETNDAVREAMVGSQLMIDEITQVNDSTWMFLSKKGTSAWSWGELVRVITIDVPGDKTRVYVVSKRKLATNVTAKSDYADDLFTQIGFILDTQPARSSAAIEVPDDLSMTIKDPDQVEDIVASLKADGYEVSTEETEEGTLIKVRRP
jgi:hypothetical protein